MDIEATLAGKVKLLTIVVGGVTLALLASTHDSQFNKWFTQETYQGKGHDPHKENYFFAITCIALICSLLLVIATLTVPSRVKALSMVDLVYHLLFAVLLLVGWVVYVISVADRNNICPKFSPPCKTFDGYTSFMAKRSFALIFQGINVALYTLVALLLFKQR